MRVLVTGGAGFIGSNFIHYMLKRHPDYKIINLDSLSYSGNLENLRDIENLENYSFVKGSITDPEILQQVFNNGVDLVIHFAAESHVDRSILDPEVFVKTNVLGTQLLLDMSKRYLVKKYVQVSTDEVYGTLGAEGLFTEGSNISPNSPYSASKAAADLIVRSYHETYQFPINITRCSNNYGPYQFPEKLIPLMVTNALENKELPVYGDGLNVRDWLHVEDHCAGIDLVLENGKNGAVYNIGGNNEKTNLDIVSLILSTLDKPKSLIKFVADRPGHDRRYAIDASKIRTELGWRPKYTFEEGIMQTISWYKDNIDWVNNVRNGSYKEFYRTQYGKRINV